METQEELRFKYFARHRIMPNRSFDHYLKRTVLQRTLRRLSFSLSSSSETQKFHKPMSLIQESLFFPSFVLNITMFKHRSTINEFHWIGINFHFNKHKMSILYTYQTDNILSRCWEKTIEPKNYNHHQIPVIATIMTHILNSQITTFSS